jgi:phosphonate transport system substrate-binding protein
VLAFLLIPGRNTNAQVRQNAPLTTLTLGLVFQGAAEPLTQHFRPLVEYAVRRLSPAGDIQSAVIVASNITQLVQLLEQNRVDFYLESPLPTYLVNRSGTAKLLLRRWKSGMSEYRGIIFTSKGSRVARLEDLRGKIIAFEDSGSTSGYFLPKLLLFEKGFAVEQKPNLDAKVATREIGYIFAGAEKNVVKLVIEEKVAAGAISNDDYGSLDEASKSNLAVLGETPALPRHLLSVRRNLPEPTVKRLKQILLDMDKHEEGRKILRQTDNTSKFDTLPGGEEEFRRKLMDLYRPRAGKR